MRMLESPPTLLSLLAIVLSSTHPAVGNPLHREDGVFGTHDSVLVVRNCVNPCGWDGLLCCNEGFTCFTDSNNQAQCGIGTSGGGVPPQNNNAGGSYWQLYTSTYVETDLVTRTSVFSSWITANHAPAPTAQELAPGSTDTPCRGELNEIPCGGNCCAVGEFCRFDNQCAAVGGVDGDPSSYYFSSVMNPQTVSPFIRPTSVGFFTITSTGAPTTTVAFQAPLATGVAAGIAATASNNGLSGGAIAGIVIGVLLGLFLLFLFCAFYCCKGIFGGLKRLLGGGPKRKQRSEKYIEERHSTYGGPGRRAWFGSSTIKPPKKSGGAGGLLGAAGGLAALAVLLGLKRKAGGRDKSSYGTGSSYTYSDYTSASSASSDRRTRNTRQSRRN